MGGCVAISFLDSSFGDIGAARSSCGALESSEWHQKAEDFSARSAPDAAWYYVGADGETNVTASCVKCDAAQGPLARLWEAKVDTGNSFAKSYNMTS